MREGQSKLDGFKFASKAEARHYAELKNLQKAGEVLFFLQQVPFHFPDGNKYVCDFQVFWDDGTVTFVDVKGMETRAFGIKMKLLKYHYPNVEILLVK